MSIVHKFLAADSTVLADKRQVLTVCSTGGVDRIGDIVVQSGIDTKSFMRAGGTVLWGHDPDKPIAKALSIGVEGGSLRALVQFPPAGVSAKSDETYGISRLASSMRPQLASHRSARSRWSRLGTASNTSPSS